MTVFKALEFFIDSGEVQNEIKKLDKFDAMDIDEKILNALRKAEDNFKIIESLVEREGGEWLVWKTISDPSIPDDNDEGTVSSYYNPTEVVCNFDDVNYFGESEVGIPVMYKCAVCIDYYIYKADYFMDGYYNNDVSITDHNKHYFEAQEEVDVEVSVILKVKYKGVKAKIDNIRSEFNDEDFEIELDEVVSIVLERSKKGSYGNLE